MSNTMRDLTVNELETVSGGDGKGNPFQPPPPGTPYNITPPGVYFAGGHMYFFLGGPTIEGGGGAQRHAPLQA